MALQSVHNKEMRLVLSSDAKPRLKWTPELHMCFVNAVKQLGGPEKATPKSLMRVMGIHGLTLYHLKSHLQKYRLGRTQQSQTYQQNQPEGMEHSIDMFSNSDGENKSRHSIKKISDADSDQTNDMKVAHALKIQMDVQKKLHEQIEVQRHLQRRIEAQGKYLQTVLRKAQETLSGYSSCSIEVEQARAQLSQLMSMVTCGCSSSSISVLTESDGSALKDARNKLLRHNGHSVESSLTSSESSERRDETEPKDNCEDSNGKIKTVSGKRNSATLSLMEMDPSQPGKKSRNITDEVNTDMGQFTNDERLNLDLNCKCLSDFDSGPKPIDLNISGV